MALTRKKAKGRAERGTFLILPHAVLDSLDLRNLSGSATKVLLMLCRQYRGNNNGDLSAPFSNASQWGIGSKSTLAKAIRELEAANLICRTRTAIFQNPAAKCSLYALTWLGIDECKGKLEVTPSQTPLRRFSAEHKNKPRPETVLDGYSFCTEGAQSSP